MANPTRQFFVFVFLFVFALVAMTACDHEDDVSTEPLPTLTPAATAVPATAVPPTAIPATAVPPTAVPATAVPPTAAAVDAPADEEAGEEGDSAVAGAGGATCLEGDWVVSESELSAYYGALGASLTPAVPMQAEGDVNLLFRDGQLFYDAAFNLVMDLDGVSAVATVNGIVEANYIAVDGVLSTEKTAGGLTASVNVDGFVIDATDLAGGILDSFPINDAPYSCDGPSIEFEVYLGVHTVELTPVS